MKGGNAMNDDYLTQLNALVGRAQKTFFEFQEIFYSFLELDLENVDIVNKEHLAAVSELANAYSQFSLDKNLDQLINFLTISDLLRSMIEGYYTGYIALSNYTSKLEKINEQLKKITIDSEMGIVDEKRKADILSDETLFEHEYRKRRNMAQGMMYPVQLLQKKVCYPYIDKDGNHYSSINEFIEHYKIHHKKNKVC